MFSTIGPSLIRTYTPIVVGSLISWLITLGVELDPSTEAGLTVSLTAILIGAYYTLIRMLEKRWPGLSVFLGSTKMPAEYSGDGAPKHLAASEGSEEAGPTNPANLLF